MSFSVKVVEAHLGPSGDQHLLPSSSHCLSRRRTLLGCDAASTNSIVLHAGTTLNRGCAIQVASYTELGRAYF